MKTKIMFLIAIVYSNISYGMYNPFAAAWDAIFGNKYEITYCNGKNVNFKDLQMNMDIKNSKLVYSINDSNWNENEKRKIIYLLQPDVVYIIDSHVQGEESCIAIYGSEVEKKLNGLEELDVVFRPQEDSVLSLQVFENNSIQKLQSITNNDLDFAVPQAMLDAMNSIEYRTAFKNRKLTYNLKKNQKDSQVIGLQVQYIRKVKYSLGTIKNYTELLNNFKGTLVQFLQDLENSEKIVLGDTKSFNDLYNLSFVALDSDSGRTTNSEFGKALKKLPFGAATQLMKSLIQAMQKLEAKKRANLVVDKEDNPKLVSLGFNMMSILRNITSEIELDFEALCADDYLVDIPYKETINGSLVGVFSVLVDRSLYFAKSLKLEAHLELYQLLSKYQRQGSSYQALVQNSEDLAKLKEIYSRMRVDGSGLPSLSLAIGEAQRVNSLLANIGYPRITAQYQISFEQVDFEKEKKHFQAIRKQFNLLQAASNSVVAVSKEDFANLQNLLGAQNNIEQKLYSTKQDLFEVTDYLLNFEANAVGVFARKLCM